MKHYHCDITAYDILKGDRLQNAVNIQLLGYRGEREALLRAKKILPGKKKYRISKIWECKTCAHQEETAELQKEIVKFIKKHIEEDADH